MPKNVKNAKIFLHRTSDREKTFAKMPSRRRIAQGKRQSELIDYREMRSDMSDVEKWISTCCQINRKQSVDIATAPTFIIRQQIKKKTSWTRLAGKNVDGGTLRETD